MIRLQGVRLRYERGRPVLAGVDLHLPRAASLTVVGSAASGKSTLVNLLLGRLQPGSGRVEVLGQDLSRLARAPLRALRRRIGVVFQRCRLLDELTVEDNVALPLHLCGMAAGRAAARTIAMLRQLDLEALARQRPEALSAGEAQRVAVARALVRRPALLVADEPTAGLDAQERQRVLEALADLRAEGSSLLILTSNERGAGVAGAPVARLAQGRLQGAQPGGLP